MLETNAKGEPNWEMTPAVKPAQAGNNASTGTQKPELFAHIAAAEIKDGMLVWRDGASGRTITVSLPKL